MCFLHFVYDLYSVIIIMNFNFGLFSCKLLHVFLCTFFIIYLHRLLSVIVVPWVRLKILINNSLISSRRCYYCSIYLRFIPQYIIIASLKIITTARARQSLRESRPMMQSADESHCAQLYSMHVQQSILHALAIYICL